MRNVIIISIIALIGAFYLFTLREGHSWGGDFSMYIHHVKNIVEGVVYEDTGYIYNPSYSTLGPETFPPVFPLLLVPAYHWFGLNFTVLKVEIVMIFLLALWCVFLSFKVDLPLFYIAVIIGITGFNPYLWDFKEHILSDIPFFLFVYLSLFFIHRVHQTSLSPQTSLFLGVIAGFLVYLAYGTRSLGLIVIPCLFMYDLVRLRTLSRFTLATTAMFMLFMILQGSLSHNDSGYLDQLTHISLERIVQNTVTYVRQLSLFWDNGYNHLMRQLVFGITGVLVIIGFLARARKAITIFEIFGFAYWVSILIFPFTQMRYLIPIFPLYVLYMLAGIQSVASVHRACQERYIFALLFIMITGSYTGKYTTFDYGLLREGIHTQEATTLFHYVQHNIREQDVIIFQKPRVLTLFTGRRASGYHHTDVDQELWDYFQDIQATYVITGIFDSENFTRFMDRYQKKFQSVFSNTDFCVYKIL